MWKDVTDCSAVLPGRFEKLKRLLRQAVNFVGLSGIGWILDFCIYTGLGMVSMNLVVNNIISSWAGVTFVFVFATKKVFQNNSRISLKWKYGIYLLYQCVLIYFISMLLAGIHEVIIYRVTVEMIVRFSSAVSKIVVTPVTMISNFFVMKGIIEKL